MGTEDIGQTQEEIGEKIGTDRKRVNERYFCPKNSDNENLPVFGQKTLTNLEPTSEFGKLELQVKEAIDSGIPSSSPSNSLVVVVSVSVRFLAVCSEMERKPFLNDCRVFRNSLIAPFEYPISSEISSRE
jgi:hypothetical protein